MPARPLAEWLTVLLWDLEGLKGKIIAPNMGKKIGSSITFIVSFSAQGAGRPEVPEDIISEVLVPSPFQKYSTSMVNSEH